jgi:hypothetical protein
LPWNNYAHIYSIYQLVIRLESPEIAPHSERRPPKATVLPLAAVNCRISELHLRSVCRELIRAGRLVSHRDLRKVLQERFGATGKTARVLRVWREESAGFVAAAKPSAHHPPPGPALPTDVQELHERLKQAEAHAAEQTARAQVAELREQSHQDRWFLEIDQLREQLRAQPNYAREVRTLQSTVTRLTVELAALRAGLSGTSGAGEGPEP